MSMFGPRVTFSGAAAAALVVVSSGRRLIRGEVTLWQIPQLVLIRYITYCRDNSLLENISAVESQYNLVDTVNDLPQSPSLFIAVHTKVTLLLAAAALVLMRKLCTTNDLRNTPSSSPAAEPRLWVNIL